jgi:hypothetical protein
VSRCRVVPSSSRPCSWSLCSSKNSPRSRESRLLRDCRAVKGQAERRLHELFVVSPSRRVLRSPTLAQTEPRFATSPLRDDLNGNSALRTARAAAHGPAQHVRRGPPALRRHPQARGAHSLRPAGAIDQPGPSACIARTGRPPRRVSSRVMFPEPTQRATPRAHHRHIHPGTQRAAPHVAAARRGRGASLAGVRVTSSAARSPPSERRGCDERDPPAHLALAEYGCITRTAPATHNALLRCRTSWGVARHTLTGLKRAGCGSWRGDTP